MTTGFFRSLVTMRIGETKSAIVRDHNCHFEQLFPGIVQKMGCEVYVRTFLGHAMNLGGHRIGQ